MLIQPKENIVETDVLVIGGGMAGLFAAIKARDEGVSVTLVDKGFVSRSGASSFLDGHITLFNPDWGHDLKAWQEQIGVTGEYMNNPEWTEATFKDSWDRVQDLLAWGVTTPREQDGGFVHPFANVDMPKGRVIDSIWLGWGWTFMPVLRRHALKVGVKIVDRTMITDLLKQDGAVAGAVGFHTQTGDFYVFQAKATVIATGTSGFKGQAPAKCNRSSFDGEAIAYRAGAAISGKEFSAFGRTRPYAVEWKEEDRVSLEGRKIDDEYVRHAPWLFATPCPAKLAGNLVALGGLRTRSLPVGQLARCARGARTVAQRYGVGDSRTDGKGSVVVSDASRSF